MKCRLVMLIANLVFLCSICTAYSAQIDVWSFAAFTSNPNLLAQLTERFTKETGISVNLRVLQSNEMNTMVRDLTAGISPDVLINVSGNAYKPLNKFIELWPERKMIPEQFMKRNQQGNITELPLSVAVNAVAYMKAQFRNAGLNEDKPPASWEELAYANEKLSSLSINNRRVGFECIWSGTVFEDFLYHNNGRILSEDGRKSLINSPAAKETLAFLVRLFQTSRDIKSPIWSTYNFQFATDTAMYYGRPYSMRVISGLPNNIAGVFVPKRCPSCSAAPQALLANSIGILPASKDDQSAWKFITWLLSPEISVALNMQDLYLPPRLDVAASVAKGNPMLSEWYKLLPNARPYSINTYGSTALREFTSTWGSNTTMRKVLLGEIDGPLMLDQIHADYQASIDSRLSQAGR